MVDKALSNYTFLTGLVFRKNFLFFYLCAFLIVRSAEAAPINFTVHTSETVTVTTSGGTPRLKLNLDGQDAYASYASGSGSTSLVFSYSPVPGDLDLDGISITSPLELNGGTITDAGGNALSPLSFSIPATSGIKLDYPSIAMNFLTNDYYLGASHYTSLPSFLSAAGGSYSRSGTATYFDSSGTLQTVGSDTPRLNHDPITLAAKGILIEESRTNVIRNSTMQGASVGVYANNSGPGGAAGSLPTNWGSRGTLASGLTAYVAATGTEYGMAYMDLRIAGTAASGNGFGVYFEGNNTVAATPGQIWSGTVYARLINNTGYTSSSLIVLGRAVGGSAATSSQDTKTLTSALTKFSVVHTVGGSAAYVHSGIDIIYTAGVVDARIRIYAPQLENARAPSSFIPTAGVAATRSPDVLTLPTGTWFSGTAGTIFVEGDMFLTFHAANPGSVAIDDGTPQNTIFMGIDMNAKHDYTIFNGGTKFFEYISTPSYVPPTVFKQSLAYETNNVIAASDGTLSPLDTSVTLPTGLTTLRLGDRRAGGARMDGHIRQFRYYPRRASNGLVQQLTQ